MSTTLEDLQVEYAGKLIELKQMYAANEITESEYKELVDDILDVEKLKSKLDEQEDILRVAQIIELLGNIAKVV